MPIFEEGYTDRRDDSSPFVLSPFRAQLAHDLETVFVNLEEFGERRTVRVDGKTYQNIPILLDEGVEVPHKNPKVTRTDYSKGLNKGTVRLYCARSDLGGHLPEVGETVELESTKRQDFWIRYDVETSGCEEGMLTLLLKKVDE